MQTDLDLEIELTGAVSEQPEHKQQPGTLVVETDDDNDRYSRLKLIPWWDQDKLRNAKIMVVGAGAIGNELIKNLALLGIGTIFIVDMDKIENSNLTRSVLFRAGDSGKYKAEVAAKQAMEINPDVKAVAFTGNVVYDLGLGAFRAMDIVLGGLDNREARLGINQACWKVTRPWVDGAIEVLHGFARVFQPPHSACYECTMNEIDFQLLSQRRSCALLTRDEMLQGKVPTTPTTSSIIAGVQVQEMLKLLHGNRALPAMSGSGLVYNGLTHDSYLVNYERKEFCMSHETYENIIETEFSAETTTLRQALQFVQDKLGTEAILDFGREMVVALTCGKCNTAESIFRQLGKVSESQGRCPVCNEMRQPQLTHSVDGTESYIDMTLQQAGIPLFDILTGRNGMEMVHFELSADREKVLNPV